MIRRPPRSTQGVSSAASDVYKRQTQCNVGEAGDSALKCEYPLDLPLALPLTLPEGIPPGDNQLALSWRIALPIDVAHISRFKCRQNAGPFAPVELAGGREPRGVSYKRLLRDLLAYSLPLETSDSPPPRRASLLPDLYSSAFGWLAAQARLCQNACP